MNAPTYDAGRMALMLNELRLPTIGQLWPDFAERSDKESWQASRLLGALSATSGARHGGDYEGPDGHVHHDEPGDG